MAAVRFPPNAAAGEAVFLRSFRQCEVWFKSWLSKECAPTKVKAAEYSEALHQQCKRLLPIGWSQWAAILVPMYGHFFVKAAQAEALRRTSITAMALRLYRHEYGRYPDRLNSLVPRYLPSVPLDPFTGKPLQYRHTPKGFRIWSIGWDGKDDGSLVRMEEHKWEKGDIVWESQW